MIRSSKHSKWLGDREAENGRVAPVRAPEKGHEQLCIDPLPVPESTAARLQWRSCRPRPHMPPIQKGPGIKSFGSIQGGPPTNLERVFGGSCSLFHYLARSTRAKGGGPNGLQRPALNSHYDLSRRIQPQSLYSGKAVSTPGKRCGRRQSHCRNSETEPLQREVKHVKERLGGPQAKVQKHLALKKRGVRFHSSPARRAL